MKQYVLLFFPANCKGQIPQTKEQENKTQDKDQGQETSQQHWIAEMQEQ